MNIEDRKIRAVTPGEVLSDILTGNEMSLAEFSMLSGIPLDDLRSIVANKKPIAQDTAQAIGKALFTSADLWLNLQAKTDRWNRKQ